MGCPAPAICRACVSAHFGGAAADLALDCDPSLAQEKLGWKAQFGIDEMCRDVWKWITLNPNGYSKQ